MQNISINTKFSDKKSYRRIYLYFIIIFFVFSGTGLSITANTGLIRTKTETKETKKPPIEKLNEGSINQIIDVLKEEMELVARQEKMAPAPSKTSQGSNFSIKSILLQSTISTYEKLLTALRKKDSLANEKVHLEERFKTVKPETHFEAPPYSLSFYDKLLNEKLAASHKRSNIDLALKVTQRTVESASEKFEAAKKELRKIKDMAAATKGDKMSGTLPIQTNLYEIEKESSEADFLLEKTNLENLQKEQQIALLEVSIYDNQLNWVKAHLEFNENDLKHQIDLIEIERNELIKRLKKIVAEKKEVEDLWIRAQQQTEKKKSPTETKESEAFLKSRDAWRNTYQSVLEQTEDMLSLLQLKEQAWRYRYSILKGNLTPGTINKWQYEIETEYQKLDETIRLQQQYYTTLQSELSLIDLELSENKLNPSIQPYISNQYQAVQKSSERLNEYVTFLFSTKELCNRFLSEVSQFSKTAPIYERIFEYAKTLQKIWNFEVWTIDDRPVTMRKLVTALIILTIGILLTKYMLMSIKKRLLKVSSIQETSSATFLKILSYISYFLVVLFTLRMVNIPLEAFAFFGGAIAIGVGFGAQNLINNFISGFIIMGERPINIGDLIEIDGILGKVEEVGARCTRIRTGENIDILVPNSSFLEKNITNWTLIDHQIRTSVTVGVIYGSPVREVEALLLKAVKAHEKTLKKPDPFVIFNDFGDNALIFIVHFWVTTYRIVERRLIESAIRFNIDELFREANIIIAFPQTDIHMDTQKPLELKLIKDDN